MLRSKDIVMLVTVYVTMAVGILKPAVGVPFQPYLTALIMVFLFLSFMNIRLDEVFKTIHGSWRSIAYLTLVKMVVLPLVVYLLFSLTFPSYALAALLLAGISTGVVAPFISNLVRANSPMVLVMVVTTSLLAPFTLPTLVKVLAGRSINLSLWAMVLNLGMIVFVPIFTVEILQRVAPKLIETVKERQFPVTVGFLALVNLAVFSRYARFFRQQPDAILGAALVAVALAALFMFFGLMIFWKSTVSDQLATAICMCNINNVLVLVFSSEFFGPLEPTVAAMYLFPFYSVIIPMGMYRRWRTG